MPDSATAAPAVPPHTLALRPREAAKALGISERLLWSLTRDGKVPHARVGKNVILYPVDALRRWLDGHTRGSPPQEGSRHAD